MNRMTQSLLVAVTTGFLLSACATPPRTAATKTYHVKSQKLVFGGTFNPDANELIITVNDDPIMKGGFPPYTPTQNLNGNYKNMQISAHCYFGSVLGSKGGKFGLIAGMIQSANSSSADKCDLTVNAKAAETLYF